MILTKSTKSITNRSPYPASVSDALFVLSKAQRIYKVTTGMFKPLSRNILNCSFAVC